MTSMQTDARPFGLVRSVITYWAIAGGFVLISIVLVNVGSIVSSAIWGRPFSGDFELTEMGAGIAAFCFLPYCQLVGANVSADIFTMKASPRSITIMSIFSSLIALMFSMLLLWRMSAGLVDYREYEEFTGILGIPIWWAFIPALISLTLLLFAALITFYEATQKLFRNKVN